MKIGETRLEQFLELIAICGELPVGVIKRLPGRNSYREKYIRKARQEKLVRIYSRDGLDGYRLTAKAKQLLLESNPARYRPYLTGESHTNRVPYRPDKRERLHRTAEAVILMQNAGVEVIRDRKPGLDALADWRAGRMPIFYTSREVKECGPLFQKVRNSRSVGLLATPNNWYAVYNMGSHCMRWFEASELRLLPVLGKLAGQKSELAFYSGARPSAILLADSMECFARLLEEGEEERTVPLNGGMFRDLYWIPNTPEGEAQIKLLCDREKREVFRYTVKRSFSPLPERGLPMEADALDKSGQPVLFCFDFDAARLFRFLNACVVDGYYGSVVCFDYQVQMIKHFCGRAARVLSIDYQAFQEEFMV